MIGTAINNSITKNWLDSLECGTIFPWAGNTAIPKNSLLCNGANVSRSTYKRLFEKIGTSYNAGDGSTTFGLPNLTNRFLEGVTGNVAYVDAGLPDIEGSIGYRASSSNWYSGCVYGANKTDGGTWDTTSTYAGTAYIDATRSSALYGKSSTVQPKALRLKFCIKY